MSLPIERIRMLSLLYSCGIPVPPIKKPHTEKLNPVLKYYTYLNSKEWQDFRDKVFRLKGRVCSKCGTAEGVINVHHLHYQTLGRESMKDVRVLCQKCHKNTHFRRRKGKSK